MKPLNINFDNPRSARKAFCGLGTFAWLGGAFHVAHMPGCGFWDGVFWLWYVGRFIAHSLTLVT